VKVLAWKTKAEVTVVQKPYQGIMQVMGCYIPCLNFLVSSVFQDKERKSIKVRNYKSLSHFVKGAYLSD